MQDIFIDNCSATRFTNKMDSEYLDLYQWLIDEGALVVSKNLINEYYSSHSGCSMFGSNIIILITELTKKGRLNTISGESISEFKARYFKKRLKLRSNRKDHNHIPVVMLSYRKLALTMDDALQFDINNFPKFEAQAFKKPSEISYR